MATRGERQALLFLAAIVLLGAGTRACRAHSVAAPSTELLDRQISAVETPGAPRVGRGRVRTAARPSSKKSNPGSGADTGQPVTPTSLVATVPLPRLDVDLASAIDLQQLPGVGPSISNRIVANREVAGAFGCLAALRQVKGIGAVRLRRLDSLVTFSGPPRTICPQR